MAQLFRPIRNLDTVRVLKAYRRLWEERFGGTARTTAAGVAFTWEGRTTTRPLVQLRRALTSERDFTALMRDVAADVRWVEPALRDDKPAVSIKVLDDEPNTGSGIHD